LSVCRALIVIESRGSGHAKPWGRELQKEVS